MDKLKRLNEENDLLLEMSASLQVSLNVLEALKVAGKYCNKLFPDSKGAFYLVKDKVKTLEHVLSWNNPTSIQFSFQFQDCWAIKQNKIYQAKNLRYNIGCNHFVVAEELLKPYICAPLQTQEQVIGLFYMAPIQI